MQTMNTKEQIPVELIPALRKASRNARFHIPVGRGFGKPR